MKILVLNAGSSSLKYQLMDMDGEKVLAKGNCERIGIDGVITHKTWDGRKVSHEAAFPTHTEAFQELIRLLTSGEGKVIDDIDRNNFNTALAAIMELSNAAGDYLRKVSPETRAACDHLPKLDRDVAETIVVMLAPMAPHWAEELWHTVLGHEGSVHEQPWPEFDPEEAKADEYVEKFH